MNTLTWKLSCLQRTRGRPHTGCVCELTGAWTMLTWRPISEVASMPSASHTFCLLFAGLSTARGWGGIGTPPVLIMKLECDLSLCSSPEVVLQQSLTHAGAGTGDRPAGPFLPGWLRPPAGICVDTADGKQEHFSFNTAAALALHCGCLGTDPKSCHVLPCLNQAHTCASL